jgi:hypothetical protein
MKEHDGMVSNLKDCARNAVHRNMTVFDGEAEEGECTIQLLRLMCEVFSEASEAKRLGLEGTKLTDIYVSPAAKAQLRIDSIYGAKIHVSDWLGDGRGVKYWKDDLNAVLGVCEHGIDNSFDREYLDEPDVHVDTSIVLAISEENLQTIAGTY